MQDTYKKLHSEWKSTKKTAKTCYGYWDKSFTDYSEAHQKVDYQTPEFPKFNMALGPSLDKLEANKDVAKSKLKAQKAVKQYTKELKLLQRAINKMTEPKDSNGKKYHRGMIRFTGELLDIVERIDKKLAE